MKIPFYMATAMLTLIISSFFVAPSYKNTANMEEEIPSKEIDIRCAQCKGFNVINNEKDYKALLNERSRHPVDFTQYTLLILRTSTGGCSPPDYKYTINKESSGKYLFNMKITENGYCKPLFSISISCLIPKLPEGAKIEYKKEITRIPG